MGLYNGLIEGNQNRKVMQDETLMHTVIQSCSDVQAPTSTNAEDEQRQNRFAATVKKTARLLSRLDRVDHDEFIRLKKAHLMKSEQERYNDDGPYTRR